MSQIPPDQPRSRRPGKPRRQPLPLYRVILLHERGQELMAVVEAVMELTHVTQSEAYHRIWEAYHHGQTQLLITHKERAELYIDQFAGRDIPVTIEPVEFDN